MLLCGRSDHRILNRIGEIVTWDGEKVKTKRVGVMSIQYGTAADHALYLPKGTEALVETDGIR